MQVSTLRRTGDFRIMLIHLQKMSWPACVHGAEGQLAVFRILVLIAAGYVFPLISLLRCQLRHGFIFFPLLRPRC